MQRINFDNLIASKVLDESLDQLKQKRGAIFRILPHPPPSAMQTKFTSSHEERGYWYAFWRGSRTFFPDLTDIHNKTVEEPNQVLPNIINLMRNKFLNDKG